MVFCLLYCSNFTQLQSQINLFLSFRFFTFSICFLFSILFYSVFKVHLVGSSGLEPPTSRLSGECSSLLSYEPIQCSSQLVLPAMVEMKRFELLTPCLQGRCSPNWATPPYSFLSFSRVPLSDPENRTTIDLPNSFTRTRISFFSPLWDGLFFVSLSIVTRDLSLWSFSIERRWSSRTFRYGYLVTT